jgi:hypothetical protein
MFLDVAANSYHVVVGLKAVHLAIYIVLNAHNLAILAHRPVGLWRA